MPTYRVVIGDDHELIIEGIRRVLEAEPDVEVVGTASNGRDLVKLAREVQPDLVLLDVLMPILNGMEAARQIKKDCPHTKLIFITQRSDRDYLREALDAGGSGYILKQSVASEISTAIRDTLAGRYYISPTLRASLQSTSVSAQEGGGLSSQELTPRQRQVLQLIAEGKSNKEIAAVLKVSVRTIEFHKAGLFGTLGLRTTAELTRYAIERGIVGS